MLLTSLCGWEAVFIVVESQKVYIVVDSGDKDKIEKGKVHQPLYSWNCLMFA